MHDNFRQFAEQFHPKLELLLNQKPCTSIAFPKEMPQAGIYLFSEGDKHLYIGRTDNMRRRLKLHCRPSSQHNQATFAFRLTREITGNLKATYKSGDGSRTALVQDPLFLQNFIEQKRRISLMDIRFVEEINPTSQALLEIYASVVLKTPYNDFNNH